MVMNSRRMKLSRRPPWSYWSRQLNRSETRAERKERRGPADGATPGGRTAGAGEVGGG
jgi:hypothetical protein